MKKNRWSILPFILFAAVSLPSDTLSGDLSELMIQKDVPYVPTPEEVVQEMLRIADVNKRDLLYDLGCGDGRIVITAARERGSRGVGVDIDPRRIRESRSNAEEAGVTDRVRFYEGDLFEVDFGEASVVTLYLLPDVNLRLRPKILEKLSPGSRVVSHNYDMDDWTPDDTSSIGSHQIYFWIVPANVGGHWEWSADEADYRLDLVQSFQNVSGNLDAAGWNLPVTGELNGDYLRIEIHDGAGGVGSTVLVGRVVGDRILDGEVLQPGEGAAPWKARRDPETKIALDGE